ncbi:hypothetical protein R1sor_007733 [Riccia sorocarpa]|uniref:Uncharacterized protein n=1 Tax=Riccia sorocarpa TaxID=122646 RepID=A0ABD3HRB4_9MARC
MFAVGADKNLIWSFHWSAASSEPLSSQQKIADWWRLQVDIEACACDEPIWLSKRGGVLFEFNTPVWSDGRVIANRDGSRKTAEYFVVVP